MTKYTVEADQHKGYYVYGGGRQIAKTAFRDDAKMICDALNNTRTVGAEEKKDD